MPKLLADTSGFGQGASEQLKIVAKERNLDPIFESFAPSDTDLVPQLSRLRDAGHHPNMEHPALFNETVLSFVRSLATAEPSGGSGVV